MTDAVTNALSGVIGTFLASWIIMLLLGALHTEIGAVPALGYSPVLLILVILDIAHNMVTWRPSDE